MAEHVGICRALHAYDFLEQWQRFITGLGLEVVVSEPTDRSMVEAGARIAPAELCLPAKVFLGHVLTLKDRVDTLFIPRFVCRKMRGDRFYGCPKALALPDMTRALIPGLPRVVELVIDERESSEERSYQSMASGLGVNGTRWKQALDASRRLPKARTVAIPGVKNGGVRIGVVGHSYLVHDDVLSMGMLDKLARAEVEVVLPGSVRPDEEKRPEFVPNWMFELDLIDAASGMIDAGVEGLLLASSFACGTSPVTNSIVRRMVRTRKPSIPVLEVYFDEHSAEAGLTTRLESFVDLLRARERRRS